MVEPKGGGILHPAMVFQLNAAGMRLSSTYNRYPGAKCHRVLGQFIK